MICPALSVFATIKTRFPVSESFVFIVGLSSPLLVSQKRENAFGVAKCNSLQCVRNTVTGVLLLSFEFFGRDICLSTIGSNE